MGNYVIEDTQTLFWPNKSGSSENLNNTTKTIGFLKCLVDGLNYSEYKKELYMPSYFDRKIVEIHFYHKSVFLKRDNILIMIISI
jgi:hypothetical protein